MRVRGDVIVMYTIGLAQGRLQGQGQGQGRVAVRNNVFNGLHCTKLNGM